MMCVSWWCTSTCEKHNIQNATPSTIIVCVAQRTKMGWMQFVKTLSMWTHDSQLRRQHIFSGGHCGHCSLGAEYRQQDVEEWAISQDWKLWDTNLLKGSSTNELIELEPWNASNLFFVGQMLFFNRSKAHLTTKNGRIRESTAKDAQPIKA